MADTPEGVTKAARGPPGRCRLPGARVLAGVECVAMPTHRCRPPLQGLHLLRQRPCDERAAPEPGHRRQCARRLCGPQRARGPRSERQQVRFASHRGGAAPRSAARALGQSASRSLSLRACLPACLPPAAWSARCPRALAAPPPSRSCVFWPSARTTSLAPSPLPGAARASSRPSCSWSSARTTSPGASLIPCVGQVDGLLHLMAALCAVLLGPMMGGTSQPC